MNIIKNKVIFLTGGTGSFGRAFTKKILSLNPKKLIIFSRDESKQWDMRNEYNNISKLEFVIGDIRDEARINTVLSNDIDYVVHAAATKIVPTAETNPEECVKTNIIGTSNLIHACKSKKIKKILGLSTDKACNPINLYGATKLAADKLFLSANKYDKKDNSKFSVVRYGNVIGSRGSVIPFFKKINKEKGYIPITDKKMTRFIISLNEAVKFVLLALEKMQGGEIFIKKIPSMNILDIAKAINPKPKLKYIGIRPGEKLHEQMISEDDAVETYEFKNFFKIISPALPITKKNKVIKGSKKVSEKFSYKSNSNKNWLNSKELKNWIKKNPYYF